METATAAVQILAIFIVVNHAFGSYLIAIYPLFMHGYYEKNYKS
jgi:hypothetical protein